MNKTIDGFYRFYQHHIWSTYYVAGSSLVSSICEFMDAHLVHEECVTTHFYLVDEGAEVQENQLTNMAKAAENACQHSQAFPGRSDGLKATASPLYLF